MSDRVFLGRYRSLRLLAEGGMSRIYLARDLERPREVAVKVLHERLVHDQNARKHFKLEIQILSELRHPNAVKFYDQSLDDAGGPLIVMEYVRGAPLDTVLLAQAPFTLQRTCHLVTQLCDLLSAIHGQGVVHRDLKPGNLMLLRPGTPQETLKVMDFGLATLARTLYIAPEDVAGSKKSVVSGTPQYISPEQARGEEMDHRGDLYCVGLLLFEMLTGHRPFPHKDVKAMLEAHESETPGTFAEVRPSHRIPAAVEAVVQQCLAKSPGARPGSAKELARAFQEAIGQSPSPSPTPETPAGGNGSPSALRPKSSPAMGREDPYAVVFHLDAKMPESIAMLKLRGFIHDLKGQIVESVPGMIRVHLVENKEEPKESPSGILSWFGNAPAAPASPPRFTEMRLHMEKREGGQQNDLALRLVLRQKGQREANQAKFRSRCNQLFLNLKSYLIGRS